MASTPATATQKRHLDSDDDDDDEELETLEGSSQEEDEEETGSETDPRLSLATTATMETIISETDTDDDDEKGDHAALPGAGGIKRKSKKRRSRRVVGIVQALLLPRSGRISMALAILITIGACVGAGVTSLALLDQYFSKVSDNFDVMAHSADLDRISLAASFLQSSFVVTALGAGDAAAAATFDASATAFAANALPQLLVASGFGAATDVASANGAAHFWTTARGEANDNAAAALPSSSLWLSVTPAVKECTAAAIAAATSQLRELGGLGAASTNINVNNGLSSTQQAADVVDAVQFALPLASIDAAVGLLAAIAPLDFLFAAITNGDYQAAAAATPPTGSSAAALDSSTVLAQLRGATAAVSLSIGALLSANPANAVVPLVAATAPLANSSQLVVNGANGGSSSSAVGQQAWAVRQWLRSANATFYALNASFGVWRGVAMPGSIQAASAAFATLMSSLVAFAPAVAPPPGVLTSWFANAEARRAAYPFNRTAISLMLRQDLLTFEALSAPSSSSSGSRPRFPWLAAQIQSNATRVREWFDILGDSGSATSSSSSSSSSCRSTLGSIGAATNSTLAYLRRVLALKSASQYADQLDGSALAAPMRDGLIATLVVCILIIALGTLYGQWGVATRVSASSLPYGHFCAAWWGVALVLMASVAWATGLGLAEADRSANRGGPRDLLVAVNGTYRVQQDHAMALLNVSNGLSQLLSTTPMSSVGVALAPSRDGRASSVDALNILLLQPLTGNLTTSYAEDDLLLAQIMRDTLHRARAEWIPDALASSNDIDLSTRTASEVSCSFVLSARAAILGFALSLPMVGLNNDNGATTTTATTATTTAAVATAAAAARRAAQALPWINQLALQAGVLLLGPIGGTAYSQSGVCGGGGGGTVSADARSTATMVDEVVNRAITRVRGLAAGDSPTLVPPTGTTAEAALQMAPLRRVVSSNAGVFQAATRDALVASPTSIEAAISGAVAASLHQTVALKRRIVWGHVGAALIAQAALLMTWRLLFGVSCAPF